MANKEFNNVYQTIDFCNNIKEHTAYMHYFFDK